MDIVDWVVYSWLPAQLGALVRVRLLSLAYTFTDCMRLSQPQVHVNCPTTLFISRLPPHLRLRLFF